jgi:hypothetical protein
MRYDKEGILHNQFTPAGTFSLLEKRAMHVTSKCTGVSSHCLHFKSSLKIILLQSGYSDNHLPGSLSVTETKAK